MKGINNNKTDELISSLEKNNCLDIKKLSILEESQNYVSEMICSICNCLALKPVCCKCVIPHLFGFKCLSESLKMKGECPVGKTNLEIKNIQESSFESLKILYKIQIKCIDCDWFGPLNILKYHLKECGAIEINCPFFGEFCQQIILKKNLKKHLEENIEIHIEAAKEKFKITYMQDLFDVIKDSNLKFFQKS